MISYIILNFLLFFVSWVAWAICSDNDDIFLSFVFKILEYVFLSSTVLLTALALYQQWIDVLKYFKIL